MGVFSKDHNPETSLKRNTFPKAFINNLTFNFGEHIPFLCKPVIEGETVEIDLSHQERFLPTVFPVQNKLRTSLSLFYVRERNLYNEFKEFYTGGTYDKGLPYLEGLTPDFFETGKLADYLGVPTVVNYSKGDVISSSSEMELRLLTYTHSRSNLILSSPSGVSYSKDNLPVAGEVPYLYFGPDFVHQSSYYVSETDSKLPNRELCFLDVSFDMLEVGLPVALGATVTVKEHFPNNPNLLLPLSVTSSAVPVDYYYCPILFVTIPAKSANIGDYMIPIPAGSWSKGNSLRKLDLPCQFSLPSDLKSFVKSHSHLSGLDESYIDEIFDVSADQITYFLSYAFFVDNGNSSSEKLSITTNMPTPGQKYIFDLISDFSFYADASRIPSDINPFINGQQPLSAMPFRAYEYVYNAFYRDERNNPLLINGKPYYDKYLPTLDGGADRSKYEIRKTNWEQDFLTTALPSPQQGDAPLVGISSTGVMTLSDADGNVYHAQAITADDNDTIVGAQFLDVNQDGTPIPGNVARSLVSYATSGISINDFRNVNALQRYLETNLRRGLKYRDLVASRWGVNISYAEMNMPEFIGGSSDYINSFQVNQTSQSTESDPLGSYAGQLYGKGDSQHKVRHFCDERGFIIGIISVIPTPVYTQLLPKMFTKFDQLDFYQPEFGHIGLQPIPMKEVAPLQVAVNGGNLNETFGYQRAWYDYISSVDEAHGQFRTTLRDFLMYRTFSGIPRLSEDFLLVDNRPLDNVFSVQEDSEGNSLDKVIAQVRVDYVSRSPIPRYGIPRLE